MFVVFVLICFWLLNVIKTISPFDTYHHDVFDAYQHTYGFYSSKAYALLIFSLVYSVALYVTLHVTASMISILKFLCRYRCLFINFFHPDNCGGTSQFGNVNLLILSIYLNFFVIIYAMYLTHRETYLVITTSLIACSLLAALQSISAVYYIHKAVAQKKRESIEALASRLNGRFAASLQGEAFPNDLLSFRNHLMGVHTFPYATGALVAVNVIRFAPAVLALVAYFKRHSP